MSQTSPEALVYANTGPGSFILCSSNQDQSNIWFMAFLLSKHSFYKKKKCFCAFCRGLKIECSLMSEYWTWFYVYSDACILESVPCETVRPFTYSLDCSWLVADTSGWRLCTPPACRWIIRSCHFGLNPVCVCTQAKVDSLRILFASKLPVSDLFITIFLLFPTQQIMTFYYFFSHFSV